MWADLANEYLVREGINERINEKSFADLGIELTATKHRGWYGDALGDKSRIIQENAEIQKENQERIIENPETIINLLNANKAVFTPKDILRELEKRLDTSELVSQSFEKILESVEYVGESVKGEFLYTGKKYKELENDTLTKFESLSKNKVGEGLEKRDFAELSDEQKNAVIGLTQGEQIGVLVGKTGAGKTRTMASVAELYKERGNRIIGMSLSAVASENLGKDAGIESRTIASWTHCWRSYEIAKEKFLSFNEIIDSGLLKQIDWYKDLKRYENAQLKKGDVIIVDEAGMVGTKAWNEILNMAEKSGAKVIAVGDNNQFEAIDSGGCFRKFTEIAKEQNQLFELTEIRRQKKDWMKEASVEFSKLNIIEGLSKYEQNNCIEEFVKRDDIVKSVAEEYVNRANDNEAVLCFKRETCQKVNNEVRELRREKGEIAEDIVSVNDRNFAINDKVMFLQNDKNLGLKNGMIGVVIGGNDGILKCKTDDNREVEINTKMYDKIEHGYAMTLYKSQGKTFDDVTVIAEKGMDAKATYVAMTRHRENVKLCYFKEEFKSYKNLTKGLSQYRQKDLVSDYQNIQNDNKIRVVEYQDSLMEMSKCLKDINQGMADWKEYGELKNHANELGSEIYKKYDDHKLYLDQMGITKEKLEIRLSLKQRPLTKTEQNAKDAVTLYADVSAITRDWFKSMMAEKFNITEHNDYQKYCEIREIRNSLARDILSNYPLHRPFVNELLRDRYISKKTMENQVNYKGNYDGKIKANGIEQKEEKRFINPTEGMTIEQIYQWAQNWIKTEMTKEKMIEQMHATYRSFDAYKMKYGLRDDIKVNEGTLEYANIVMNKNYKGENIIECMKDAVKQALCFEILKKDFKDTNLNLDIVRDIHKKAEMIAHNTDYNDFTRDKQNKFNEIVQNANNEYRQKSEGLSQNELSGLLTFIQNENMQKEQQRQLELQRSINCSMQRGSGIEI